MCAHAQRRAARDGPTCVAPLLLAHGTPSTVAAFWCSPPPARLLSNPFCRHVLQRDINAGRFADNTSLVLVTHGLALRIFLMRWFHWTVDQFMDVFNPVSGAVRGLDVLLELDCGAVVGAGLHYKTDEPRCRVASLSIVVAAHLPYAPLPSCCLVQPNAEPLVLERVPTDTEARQGGPASWIHTKVGWVGWAARLLQPQLCSVVLALPMLSAPYPLFTHAGNVAPRPHANRRCTG